MHLYDAVFHFAVFFIIGITAADFGINVLVALTAAAALSIFIFRHTSRFATIFVLTALAGMFYLHLYNAFTYENIPFGEKTEFSGRVIKNPENRIKSQVVDVKLNAPQRGRVRIYADRIPRMHYGDSIHFSGEIEKSPSGSVNMSLYPKIVRVEGGEEIGVRGRLFALKNRMSDNLKRVMPARDAALAGGLLFGERAEFSEEFREAMRKSGTTHIVALSGYNIAIVAITLLSALSYIMNRKYAFYASAAAIPAFVIMTGAEPSVVRAGIMGLILLVAERKSRMYNFRNAVTLTAFTMLLFNPHLIVFDAGFQLSFAALLGIVYVYPRLKELFGVDEANSGILNWKVNTLQTLSAQLAVAPIALMVFGYISPTAILANILILEFIPVTMFTSFVAAVLGFVSHELSIAAGMAASFFLGYETFIINLFAFNWI